MKSKGKVKKSFATCLVFFFLLLFVPFPSTLWLLVERLLLEFEWDDEDDDDVIDGDDDDELVLVEDIEVDGGGHFDATIDCIRPSVFNEWRVLLGPDGDDDEVEDDDNDDDDDVKANWAIGLTFAVLNEVYRFWNRLEYEQGTADDAEEADTIFSDIVWSIIDGYGTFVTPILNSYLLEIDPHTIFG